MASLNESLIKALQDINSDKALVDKFKSCSKENVYDMLKEKGYEGSTQEFEKLLSNIEREIGDILMKKKSDADLSNVSGGKGENYFKKSLALGLTALSVGGSVQQGISAAEVNQNATTKSFGEKAKEFFSKAKGKVSGFVDAHPGATLLLALGATNVANSFITWGLTKRHYNKTQTEIKQEINGARAQLLATCKDVIGVESGKYEGDLKKFEAAVDNKVKEFKFDKDSKIDNIEVSAIDDFKALFGSIADKNHVFNALSTITGDDLGTYITNIRAEIAKKSQNDSSSKFANLEPTQLSFLGTVIGYAENVVMLKQAEHIKKVTSEVTGAKKTITDNLDSIQSIITKENEEAFVDNTGTWRSSGSEKEAKAYKAVVTKVREGFENVLKSVFGSLENANKVETIKKAMIALTFFEENIITGDNKLENLKGTLPAVSEKRSGKTVLSTEADETIVKALANAANLKGFVNVILGELKKVTVEADASGLAAKFEVVKNQGEFLSSGEKTELEKKASLINEILELMTINGLKVYENKTTEFADLNAAKEAFTRSEFVRAVNDWVTKLKENQGENKIFADTKLNDIKNLSERVEEINDGNIGQFATNINNKFVELITELTNLFKSAENFGTGYKESGVHDVVVGRKQGIFADNYANKFKIDASLFKKKGKEEEKKTFEVNKKDIKNLRKDDENVADNLEDVEFGANKLKFKKDTDNSNSLNGKIGGNSDNLKVLLCAIVGNVLYNKLNSVFDSFDKLKGVEISKTELDKKGEGSFSYEFFAKLNEVADNGDEAVSGFKQWIKDTVGLNTKAGEECVTKSIWGIVKENNA